MAQPIPHTFTEESEVYLQREKGRNSLTTYRRKKSHLKGYEKWLETNDKNLLDVSIFAVENFLFELSADDYANSSVKNYYATLRHFYAFLADKMDMIEESPFENFDKKQHSAIFDGTKKEEETKEQITYFSPEQIDQLCDTLNGEMSVRNELMIRLMFQTGVRVSECMDIELSDIDRDERSIKIFATKTHNNRKVFYQSSLDTLLDLWITRRNAYMSSSDSDNVFISKQSPRLLPETANEIVKKAASDSPEIDQKVIYVDKLDHERVKYSSHSLRHSHAIESIKSGIDIRRVQMHLGHSSIETTMKYLRFVNTDTKRAYQSKFGQR